MINLTDLKRRVEEATEHVRFLRAAGGASSGYTADLIEELAARADAAEARVKVLEEALDLHPGWSLERGYHNGDEDDEYGWIVFQVRGGINDTEWHEIGFGATPLEALQKAHAHRTRRLAALASKEEGGR